MPNKLVLKSFFMGGFECADHINRSGERINLQTETLHHEKLKEDYSALKEIGISVVREGVCWSEVETAPYTYDFSRLLPFFKISKQLDIQIIWDMCHFGYPDDLIPTHPLFTDRFRSYCEEFTKFHLRHSDQIPWIVPINEISFLSWHSGDMRGTVPFAVNSGWDIKYHLCKAAIMGIKSIKAVCPECVVLVVEPLVKVHQESPYVFNPEVEKMNNFQYQAMDIVLGRTCPELMGDPGLVDVLGFNYYYNNQWTENHVTLPWPDIENRLTPFSDLLAEVSKRYQYPIIITETGHFGDLRPQWLQEIISECRKAIKNGVDLRGMCIYPVIDRPDWDDLSSYSNCGLWDFDEQFNRIPHKDSLQEVIKGVELVTYGL